MVKKKKAKKAKKKKAKKKKVLKRKTKAKKKTNTKKKRKVVHVTEIRSDYGGVIRMAQYENRRVTFGNTITDKNGFDDPIAVANYGRSLAAEQFYQAQIEVVDVMPQDMKDELGDISKMPSKKVVKVITDAFDTYLLKTKKLTPKQKKERIKEINKDLQELTLKLLAEDKRLKKIAHLENADLLERINITEDMNLLKKERDDLRRQK